MVAALVELVNVVLVDPIMEILSWLDPLAFYFGIFLPSLPYTIFMIAVVGWLLAVLQTVFAAPLWAVMHMTPDRTFVGSQTQGYLMLLSLFMRPDLIIAALFAAMALANPIILYVSKAFWTMRTANVSSAESIGFLVQFLTFKNWLIMYGMLLLPIVYMIFGLFNTLPDAILTWIGAGIKPLGETQATAEMRSGMERHGASLAAGAAIGRGGKPLPGGQKKIGNDKNGSEASGDSAADSKPISDTGQASVSTQADYVAPASNGQSNPNAHHPVASSSVSAHAASKSALSPSESISDTNENPKTNTDSDAHSLTGVSSKIRTSSQSHKSPSNLQNPSESGEIVNAGTPHAAATTSSEQQSAEAITSSDTRSVNSDNNAEGHSSPQAQNNFPPNGKNTNSPLPHSSENIKSSAILSSETSSPVARMSAKQEEGQMTSQNEQPAKSSIKMFKQEAEQSKSAAG